MPGPASSAGVPAEHRPARSLLFACSHCGKRLAARAEAAGREGRCPGCGRPVLVPAARPGAPGPGRVRRFPFLAATLLGAALVGCAIHGKLSCGHGGEYFNIARALSRGRGFADPFADHVGPTAWMAPVYPTLLAGLYRLGGGDRGVVTAALVGLHVCALVGSGVLVLALARQTTRRLGAAVTATVFLLATLTQFTRWFRFVDDGWLILLCLDGLVAGSWWLRPPGRWPTAAAWGAFGGLCLLTSPIVGFAWGVLSLTLGVRRRAWSGLAVALACAGLALAPWTVRNYLVFGRLIPVKSNLAYELYQSQCLQPDGLLQNFQAHPSGGIDREGQEYRKVGETAYLDHKRQQFLEAVRADPVDFLDRVATRFLGATLWYVPFDRAQEAKQPWLLRLRRLAHPLPFLALLVLVFTAVRQPLAPPQWTVIGVYLFYLLPYVATSYYDRYALPLVGVKVLLVIWAADRLLCWRRADPPAPPA